MASAMLGRSSLLRVCPTARAFQPAVLAPLRQVSLSRGVVQVVAAEPAAKEGKKAVQKKKMPSPVKRAQLSKERRMTNKSHKSACATRVKKVIKLAESMMASPPKSEADVKELETVISRAYTEIDKAVQKGVLHENNGARKKARCARYKKLVLMAAGLYVPKPEDPSYARYQKLQAAKSS